MRESSLWKWLKNSVTPLTYELGLEMSRIENDAGMGTPDVEGIFSQQFWIELKRVNRPKRLTTKIKPKFQPHQVPWLERRWKCGGNSWVLLQIGEGHEAARYLIPGYDSRKLKDGLWTEDELKIIAVNHNKCSAIDIVALAGDRIKALAKRNQRLRY